MIRIVIAGIAIAAVLIGCESKTDRQNRTEPESPLLLEPQSPLLMDYKEIPGRQVEDVSPDGKFVLVGWGDAPSWARGVVNTESANSLGQLKGESGFGIRSKFLPGSNDVFIEEHIFAYKLWEFGKKNRTVGCSTGKMDSLAMSAA